MTKRNNRILGALLLVMISLMLASLACYSGQIPGVFELTPYHTPTPMPVAENPRFSVLETVLTPHEIGSAYFSLTIDPEPLQANLMNSKESCQSDSSAQVLYAGQGQDGQVYYLIVCGGSVGWSVEDRLAGPLAFSKGDLAMALAATGEQSVALLDDDYNPMPFNPLQTCKPQTIVSVTQVLAVDNTETGLKNLYYQVNCPTTGGPLKGWLTNADLFGPIELNVGERALAVSSDASSATGQYQMASEPAPLTDTNVVAGDCPQGSILEAQEARLIDSTIYFRMKCGETEGWVDQTRFVGPLLYDVGDATVIYVEPIPVFEDQLASLTGATATPEAGTEGEDTAATTDTGETTTEDQTIDPSLRRVVEYTPPLYLTNAPGEAVPEGDGANVVGQCTSNATAVIEEYAAQDTVYYRIQCDECVATETDVDGNTACTATEARDGWVQQKYLQGPLDYVVGDKVAFKSTSKAIVTDDDGSKYARLPANLTGAASIGQYTEFTGRCPLDAGAEVTGVVLEKARTADKFTFYYQVQCMGQLAMAEQVTGTDGVIRTTIGYDAENPTTVTGILSSRDLQAAP